MTIAKALSQFYQNHGLPDDGGITLKWAKYKFGTLTIPIPNTRGRKRALLFHDIHHVITGYEGELKDEVAIGAWEVASGCKDYYYAWLLNLWAFGLGLFGSPKYVYKAFIRGLYSGNLYKAGINQHELMNMEVDTLKLNFNLDQIAHKATPGDNLKFVLWSLIAFLSLLLPILILLGVGWLITIMV